MAVDKKGGRVQDEVFLEVVRLKRNRRIAFPENGALSRNFINQDERCLARAAARDDPMRLDAFACHFAPLKITSGVIADFADIARAKSPTLTGNHGAGDLACPAFSSTEEISTFESRVGK